MSHDYFVTVFKLQITWTVIKAGLFQVFLSLATVCASHVLTYIRHLCFDSETEVQETDLKCFFSSFIGHNIEIGILEIPSEQQQVFLNDFMSYSNITSWKSFRQTNGYLCDPSVMLIHESHVCLIVPNVNKCSFECYQPCPNCNTPLVTGKARRCSLSDDSRYPMLDLKAKVSLLKPESDFWVQQRFSRATIGITLPPNCARTSDSLLEPRWSSHFMTCNKTNGQSCLCKRDWNK